MRNRISEKIIYWKLISFFIMLSFIIVILLTVVFRSIYMEAAYKEATSDYRDSLSRISMGIRQLNEEVDYLFISVISNPVVESFLNQPEWDPYEEYKVRTEFSRFKHIHSRIHSMYIYSGQLRYFVSTQSGGADYEGFPDREVIHAGQERKNVMARELPGASGEAAQKVISYVYTKYAPDGQTIEHSIVINVPDFFAAGMPGAGEASDVLLLDKNGELLASSVQGPAAGILRDKARLEEVLSRAGSGEGASLPIGGRTYTVSSMPVDAAGWTLLAASDRSELTSFVLEKTNPILYIGCAVLLLSIVPIAFMARTIYSPIDLFIKRMNKSELVRKRSGNRQSELDYIMDGVADMLERMKELAEHNDKNKRELRHSFLKRLLTGAFDDSYLQEKSQQYEFHDQAVNRRVILLRVDEYYKVKPEHRHLYVITAEQIAKDCLQQAECIDSVMLEDGKIALIVDADAYPDMDVLRERLKDIQQKSLSALGRSLTIAVGRQAETLRELGLSYEHALGLSDCRLTAGYGQLLEQSYADSRQASQLQYPSEIERTLIDCIKLGKEAGLPEALDRLELALQTQACSDAHLVLLQLAVSCIRTVNGIMGENNGSFDFRDDYRKLDELEVLDDWKTWYMDLFVRHRSRIEELNAGKNNAKTLKMIQEAIDYIGENYGDVNLTVDAIAGKFGYSANYFAKLFKETTGQFINDHIRCIKIERAKNLLKETKLAVSEIAELTGYLNKNYFFYAFKKDTGMTPLSYRELNG
ncbi:AraC family transcriptional regulator [Paenibacillus arenilitoris]|uniref:Helix-turn-helix domain-containing protein n=1 Tax=Paenibacillus arenilitoris TaxID=2772299 RepID=A0A927CMU4_9BACL|nr:AraC family transcriptional regulator [Paenibacillus arenilitoris]MBD2870988.1 helix-turn-helix domain-containing protein [Paenibacillus arenilitoris]